MMEIDQFLHQGQPDPGTVKFFPGRIVHLVETIEYSILQILWDTNASI